MKTFSSFIIFLLLYCGLSLTAQPTIQLEEIAMGFASPVDITHAGDERLFIVEQSGRIKILDKDKKVLDVPFLDIQNKLSNRVGEEGLLGLAFHPDYKNNGYFFVNYTSNIGAMSTSMATRIVRYSVSSDNPNVADPDSELVILTADQPYRNHNGGGIKFGADGYLYIGMGDGGNAGDPLNLSQNPTHLLGKMLRIDIDSASPYAIPLDNPFVNDSITREEIWATGLRNPWRFSFDRVNNDLWIGDVGQNKWEEVDYQPAGSVGGENYGWRCTEGFEPFISTDCVADSLITPPVFTYQTGSSDGFSITGGFVYRGTRYPTLTGHYIYGDYVSGKIWSLIQEDNGAWNNKELLTSEFLISTFGEDAQGELYVAAHRQGRIYQIKTDQTSPTQTIATMEQLSLTPNPFQDFIDLKLKTSTAEIINIQLLNTNGQIIYQTSFQGIGAIKQTIGLKEVGKGVYFLQIRQGEQQLVRKVVKD